MSNIRRPTFLGAAVASYVCMMTGCAQSGALHTHSPQVSGHGSTKTAAAIQRCIESKLIRYGPPSIGRELDRVVMTFEQTTPKVTVVINELERDYRSIEAWKVGLRDAQLRKDVLACK